LLLLARAKAANIACEVSFSLLSSPAPVDRILASRLCGGTSIFALNQRRAIETSAMEPSLPSIGIVFRHPLAPITKLSIFAGGSGCSPSRSGQIHERADVLAKVGASSSLQFQTSAPSSSFPWEAKRDSAQSFRRANLVDADLITQDDGGDNLFVHRNHLPFSYQRCAYGPRLIEGERVQFDEKWDVVLGQQSRFATNVRGLRHESSPILQRVGTNRLVNRRLHPSRYQ
jgi:cold shock CspA family protein